jgi:uncharacterized membrane protein YfcA
METMEIYYLVGGLGLISGFLSGLLGIGGGIVMAPLLLYVPPLLGMETLTMKSVAGLTIVQGLAACLSGSLIHKKLRFVSNELSLYMGSTIFIFAAIGGAGSRFVSDSILLFIFACLAFTASIFMLLPTSDDSERPDVAVVKFSRFRALITASGVGLLGGLVGQGGSFILIPLMTSYVHIPTRIAIGSNLAIVLLSTFAGFLGKSVTGQIDWLLTLPIILTVVPAAVFGGLVSRLVSVLYLRRLLALLIGLAAVRMWICLFL